MTYINVRVTILPDSYFDPYWELYICYWSLAEMFSTFVNISLFSIHYSYCNEYVIVLQFLLEKKHLNFFSFRSSKSHPGPVVHISDNPMDEGKVDFLKYIYLLLKCMNFVFFKYANHSRTTLTLQSWDW